ncbi:2OG-Fe(II) oxygenase [Pedobacter frigiditerrae]|uniref:2OG-Fe(II) oxygenase n=1 Tax=Pedobacter frigiditerrae TaxID=2530452 RepID=UPI0029303ECC|nr:2OG-Fe(II) oxygenase [Pedobacter frigiditerrae]
MKFLHPDTQLENLASLNKKRYQTADPFPSIVFENFFDAEMLDKVLAEFPDLEKLQGAESFNNHNEKKFGTSNEAFFGDATRLLLHYLNSGPILKFLQELTGIKETLVPDPYFIGGGCHEIKQGGLLKVHADFNKHRLTGLDRRINLLVYLNKDWEADFGGHFELWDKDMESAVKKVLPLFNTVAIFSTTDFSYHGHPDPLNCPPDRSRKSLALYYYTHGRPITEINSDLAENTTAFVSRKAVEDDVRPLKRPIKTVLLDYIPPVIIKLLKKRSS